MSNVFEPILCGLSGFVIVEILMQPYEVFGWWPPLLRRLLFGSPAVVDFEDMKWWQIYIYKPLAGCGVCFSGWVAIWHYFFNEHFSFSLSERYAFFHGHFDFFNAVFFVSLAIFTAWCLGYLKNFLKSIHD